MHLKLKGYTNILQKMQMYIDVQSTFSGRFFSFKGQKDAN